MKELISHPTTALAAIAGMVSAVILLIGVAKNNERIRTQWARRSTALAAVLVLVFCAGTLLLLIEKPSVPRRIGSALTLINTTIGSIGAGVLITLFISRSLLWKVPTKEG